MEKMDKALKESGEVNQGKMQINFKKFFLLYMVLKNMVNSITNHTPQKLDILADFLSFFLQIICTDKRDNWK